MGIMVNIALVAVLAGNLLMLWRGWPVMARALAGPASGAGAHGAAPIPVAYRRPGRDWAWPALAV